MAALVVVIGLTGLTFASVARFGFVNWDDDYALVLNDRFRGFGWENLRWMFTTGFAGHYQPLTWLSYALDYRIWGGLDPGGYHVTNLLLHVATAVGFYFVARKLLRVASSEIGSGVLATAATLAALLFAIHPLRVESVAWVTERRDVLSAAFLMPALLLYLRAATTRDLRAYRLAIAGAVFLYLLSLLSKAAAMTLPVVLLLIDFYPLRRFDRVRAESGATPKSPWKAVLLEKVLFLVPALGSAGLALWAQAQSGALRTAQEHSFDVRLAQALYGIGFYVWKSVWPHNLLPLYEQRFDVSPWNLATILALVFAIAITALVWSLRRRLPALLVAWFSYLVVLSPVLGLAQSGPQVVADRYTYLSCLSWAVIAGGAFVLVWGRSHDRPIAWRAAVVALPVVAIVLLSYKTQAQVAIWSDSDTLWRTVIQRAPDTGTAYANLAADLNGRGEYEEAYETARKALEILPGNVVAHVAAGRAAGAFGEKARAKGDRATAERWFRESELHYEEALKRWPDDRGTLAGLVATKMNLGKFDEAAQLCNRLIELDPGNPIWPDLLGRVRASAGEYGAAEEAFVQSLSLDPDRPETSLALANVYLAQGRRDAAIGVLEKGIDQAPNEPRLCARLAWILATLGESAREYERALQLAQVAMRTQRLNPMVQEAYAAALAATGRFGEAAASVSDFLTESAKWQSPFWKRRLETQRAGYERGEMPRD
ncbi:MAG: tetratricopeptide repeat protein [Phycisphaerae bacterium]|nr:tetratricopeptide repeat protein [Phycisphaerae bacterium]